MRDIYIFDIDGCIMPPIFSNFIGDESRKNIVKKAITNGNNIELFPGFIKFYKKYCNNAESIFFITGRKRSEFGRLTENQLKSLSSTKKFHIIYYPEKKSHKIKKYFSWKVKEIKKIIRSMVRTKSLRNSSEKNIKFNIFDDLNEYFPKIKDFLDISGGQIQLSLIENEDSWNCFFD